MEMLRRHGNDGDAPARTAGPVNPLSTSPFQGEEQSTDSQARLPWGAAIES